MGGREEKNPIREGWTVDRFEQSQRGQEYVPRGIEKGKREKMESERRVWRSDLRAQKRGKRVGDCYLSRHFEEVFTLIFEVLSESGDERTNTKSLNTFINTMKEQLRT